MSNQRHDLAVIGAGPIGIAVARSCAEAGLHVALIDAGPICGAMYRYPLNMRFFSTAERIAICEIPFPSTQPQPTRQEGLAYYRLVARHERIDWMMYRRVTAVEGALDDFTLATDRGPVQARRVVVATGFFNRPVMLDVPGEELPHVSHYFTDGHAYAGQKLVIVGAANSAVIAALECWRHGAEVTVVHRGSHLHGGVKYWLRPDFENRVEEGAIDVLWNTELQRIGSGRVHLRGAAGERQLPADFVLALTGYRADYDMLRGFGLELDERGVPRFSEASYESSRPGVFCAGCVLCGEDTGSLFIENGRLHAEAIARTIANQLAR